MYGLLRDLLAAEDYDDRFDYEYDADVFSKPQQTVAPRNQQRTAREGECVTNRTAFQQQQDAGYRHEVYCHPQSAANCLTQEQQGDDYCSNYLEVIEQRRVGCRTGFQTEHHQNGCGCKHGQGNRFLIHRWYNYKLFSTIDDKTAVKDAKGRRHPAFNRASAANV